VHNRSDINAVGKKRHLSLETKISGKHLSNYNFEKEPGKSSQTITE